jgi:hypothetical protein
MPSAAARAAKTVRPQVKLINETGEEVRSPARITR